MGRAREYVREQEQQADTVWTLAEGEKPLTSDKTLWRYLSLANKQIAESCRTSSKRLLQRHQAQRRHLYAKANSAGDYRTALACLDSEAKLQGLFEDEIVRQMDAMQKQIEELKASHANSNTPPAPGRDASGPGEVGEPGNASGWASVCGLTRRASWLTPVCPPTPGRSRRYGRAAAASCSCAVARRARARLPRAWPCGKRCWNPAA